VSATIGGEGTREPAPAVSRGRARAAVLPALLSATGYAVLVAGVMAPVWKAPAQDVLFPGAVARTSVAILVESDQRFVSGTLARNARLLASEPSSLLEQGSCFPISHAFTLGEHVFGESLLAVVPWVLLRDPVLVTNAVVGLSIWLAALAMYALVFGLTRSAGAAFVAGLVFAFHPARLENPAHPMVHGNLWTPLAILWAQRLFTRRRWRDAALLACALSLALLESFYQILGLAILGGVYGAVLAVRLRRELLALSPKIAVVVLACAAVASQVLLPYLDTRSAWGVLQGRGLVLMWSVGNYLPGGAAGFGWVPLILAAVGLIDRARGPRGEPAADARLPLVVGGLLVLWCSVYAIEVPGLGRMESPLRLLSGVVPGLDAVRVLRALRFNVYLVVAFLAGYGVIAIASAAGRSTRSPVARALVPLAAAFLVVLEVFVPRLARAGYGAPLELVARTIAPPPEVAALYERTPPGAVLDLPFRFDARGRLRLMARYVFLAGYHGRPVAGCYNSFDTPLQGDIERLAARLPDPGAADEIRALGFGSLVLHGEWLGAPERARLEPLLADPSRVSLVGSAGDTTLLALASPSGVAASFAALAEVAGATPVDGPKAGEHGSIAIGFTNPTVETYRHPDPIEPSRVIVRWRDGDGRTVHAEELRVLLPIALAPGRSTEREIDVLAPAVPGEYAVELALAAMPERVLGRARVRVRASSDDPLDGPGAGP
jgi:hypothetical protein